jgi:hypothetical protein
MVLFAGKTHRRSWKTEVVEVPRTKQGPKSPQTNMSGYLQPTPRTGPNSRASSVFDFPQHERVGRRTTTDARYVLSPSSPGYLSPDENGPPGTPTGRYYRTASYMVVSGGTGCNAICSVFPQTRTCYVLPVTDDGGSSSEIIRVIGKFLTT